MHEEVVQARGHENVTATHASTFEVTSDDYLTPAGDCILAVEADRTPADFDEAFVAACQDADATIRATIGIEDEGADGAEGAGEPEGADGAEGAEGAGEPEGTDGAEGAGEPGGTEGTESADEWDDTITVEGRGDPALTFESDRSLVGRTSEYVDDRTVLLEADRPAGDLPRDLVDSLADGAPVTLRLAVE